MLLQLVQFFDNLPQTTLNFITMNDLLRGLLAGYGAKKLGGGCISTVVIFLVLWYVLGQCS